MKRRFTPRFTRGKRTYCWESVYISSVYQNSSATQVTLTTAVNINSLIDKKATLTRIVGTLSFGPDVIEAQYYGVYGYIRTAELGATGTSPLSSACYNDQDILWTMARTLGAAATTNTCDPVVVPIDVKSKRKLDNDFEVQLVIRSDTAGTAVLNGIVRSLWQW